VSVENTGPLAGDEVVQLYVHPLKSRVKRPAKELRGFQRVSLKPGERQTAKFTLRAEQLAVWDEAGHAFVVEPGNCEISVGASSADIRATAQVVVVTTPE
jgi:beta-glucosidase